jgi:hypothetical protein
MKQSGSTDVHTKKSVLTAQQRKENDKKWKEFFIPDPGWGGNPKSTDVHASPESPTSFYNLTPEEIDEVSKPF